MINLKYKKINYIIFSLLTISLITLIYGTSLSCDYRIKIYTKNTSYDGICELGRASWIETENNSINGSIWHVTAWSFSFKNKLSFLITGREQLHKFGKQNNRLDIYNKQLSNINFLSYEYYDISKNHLAIFSNFPEQHVYIAKINGRLSLFSSKKNNRKP